MVLCSSNNNISFPSTPWGICSYLYGSRVYGTNTKYSDWDWIIVAWEAPTLNDPNHTFYTPSEFILQMQMHEISVLECLWLPEDCVQSGPFGDKWNPLEAWELHLPTLRNSLSQKSSNSWVKAKKKLLQGDYHLGIKSLFHSFRILEFGTQIATDGKITSYGAANWLWEELMLLSKNQKASWGELESLYKNQYNQLRTKFRLLAPKE